MHESARPLIDALLKKIEQAGTPEKVAENDYLMRCRQLFFVVSLVPFDTVMGRCHACDYYRTVVLGGRI